MDRRTFVKLLAITFLTPDLISATGVRSLLASQPPSGVPEEQFAWNDLLRQDSYGNPQLPFHNFLAMLDVNGEPNSQKVSRLEGVLSRLEELFPRRSAGVLFLLGWGPSYFRDVLGLPDAKIPIPNPQPLSSFETPTLDRYHACLHVAGDQIQHVEAVRAALFEGRAAVDRTPVDLDVRSVFQLKEIRTGFVGAPLPSEHQDAGGIPPGHPVPATSPLFMGFHSGFRGNQATEEEITITKGYFRGGTTMHVSRLRLRLNDWYTRLTEEERVARMFSPFQTASQVANFTDNPPVDPDRVVQAAKRHGVVGHAQKSARARRNGRPIMLRRDFNTIDGDNAGLHFVALQRSIDDFVAVRRAMNGENLPYENPAIQPRINNGILEFMFVLNRANFIVPPRWKRSFPLLEKVNKT